MLIAICELEGIFTCLSRCQLLKIMEYASNKSYLGGYFFASFTCGRTVLGLYTNQREFGERRTGPCTKGGSNGADVLVSASEPISDAILSEGGQIRQI